MFRHILTSIVLFSVLFVVAQDAAAQGFKYLEVKVIDPDGKPLAGVPVEFSVDGTRFPMPTDATGKVGVNVPVGDNTEVEIRVKHQGHTAMAVGWRGKKVPESATIPLKKGVTFGGIVKDEQGRPVEGVAVSGDMLWNNRHGLVKDGEIVPFFDGEFGKTDTEGRWKCSMGPGDKAELHLSFSHPHFLNLNSGLYANWEELKAQKRVDVLSVGVSLTGEVLLPDGKTLPQTMVQITKLENGGTIMWHEMANAEGKFRFERLPKGPAILSVQTAKYAPLKMRIEVQADMEPLAVKLENGKKVQLKLVNEASEALNDARVEIVDWRYHRDDLELGNKSEADDQGMWGWNLVPSGELTYQVSAPGYRTAKHKLKLSDEIHTITLKPPAKVTGRVIDKATGEPIKKFKLMGIATIECGIDKNCLTVFNAHEVSTSGEYEFLAGLHCKEFYVSCSANGYKSSNTRAISPDEDLIQWDFEMEREVPESKGN